MKKIYNNRLKRALVFGNKMLLPGTNVVEEIDVKKFPQIGVLIDNGDVAIEEDTEKAVKAANTQKAVDAIVAESNGDKKTKAAAEKRKQQLDKIDEDAKKATKEAAKDEEDKDGDME